MMNGVLLDLVLRWYYLSCLLSYTYIHILSLSLIIICSFFLFFDLIEGVCYSYDSSCFLILLSFCSCQYMMNTTSFWHLLLL